MSRLKIDIRNIDIMKVSPLMVEGYRYWLNNISRYSYNFYNLKSNKQIILKINELSIIDLNWSKLIVFLKKIFFYGISNSKKIILKKISKLYKINKYFDKNANYFFQLFFVDNSDILNIKLLQTFSTNFFGYNIISFIKQIPLNIINKLNFCFFKKNSNSNYINLDLQNLQTINFQVFNLNNIINLNNNIKNITFQILMNYIFIDILYIKFFNNKDFNININLLNKFKIYYNFYNYFKNNIICNKKNIKYYINYNNIKNLDIKNLINKKFGIIFFNNLLYYNLNFLGNFSKIPNTKKNFNLTDIFLIFDNTSYINWIDYIFHKITKKKLLIINCNINNKLLLGLNLPIRNIVETNKNLYINSFGNVILNNAIFVSKNYKSLNFMFTKFHKI